MINLCINEFTKIFKKKIVLIFIAAVIITLVVEIFLCNGYINSTMTLNGKVYDNDKMLKEQLENLNSTYEKEKKNYENNKSEESKKKIEEVKVFYNYYNYALENDIPIFIGNKLSFTYYWKRELIYKLIPLELSLVNSSEENKESLEKEVNYLKDILYNDKYEEYIEIRKEDYKKENLKKYAYEARIYAEELNKEYELTRYADPANIWKLSSRATIVNAKERLLRDGSLLTNEQKEALEEKIELEKYKVKNNINTNGAELTNYNDSYVSGAENAIIIVLTLFMIIISASIVSSEFSKGTIKQVFITPNKRWKILLAKIITLLVILIVLSILLSLLIQLFGSIFFGEHKLSPYVYMQDNQIKEINPTIYHILRFLLQDIKILVYIIFGVMLSTLFKSSIFPVSITMILFLIDNTLLSYVINGEMEFLLLKLVTPFFPNVLSINNDFYLSLMFDSSLFIVKSFAFAICLITVFLITSFKVFNRKMA